MVEEVIQTVQQLLQGQSYQSFEVITSDSSYLNPCRSIVSNAKLPFDIRFNVCKMIHILIEKFASTSWFPELFIELDEWFLSLIDTDDLLNSGMSDLSSNSLLTKEIGKAYACLLFSYRQKDEEDQVNFQNFIPKISEIMSHSKSREITCFNFMSGMCQFFEDVKSNDYLIEDGKGIDYHAEEMANFVFETLQKIETGSETEYDIPLFQSSFELLNSIFLIYHIRYDFRTNEYDIGDDEIKKTVISNCPFEILRYICIQPTFIQSFLFRSFLIFDNINLRHLSLDLMFHIVSITTSDLLDTKNVTSLYAYICKDLIDLINFIFENDTLENNEWEYINYIVMISYKMQLNIRSDYISDINYYDTFLESFDRLCEEILFSDDNENIVTNSAMHFFSNSSIFNNSLLFWSTVFMNFTSLSIELKTIVFNSMTNIVDRCIGFLFKVIHEDSESTFNSLQEKNYYFYFIKNMIQMTRPNIKKFVDDFTENIEKICEVYLNDRYSVDNELDACLIISICTQFMVDYSAVDSSNYINYNVEDFDKPGSESFDFCIIEYPILSQILNLINETSDDESLTNYGEFHRSSSTSLFLEYSILNFIYNFKYMIFFNEKNFDIKRKLSSLKTSKDEIVSLLISRLCNDINFYSTFSFDFNIDVLLRVLSIMNQYSEQSDSGNLFIYNEQNFEILLKAGDSINETKNRKRFYDILFKCIFDNNEKDHKADRLIEILSDRFNQLFENFDQKMGNQEGIQEFNHLLIDTASLFKIPNEHKNYGIVFNSIFLKYFQFFVEKSDQIFQNEELAPCSLSLWLSIVKGKSRIKFPKYSPNGIILIKSSLKILSSFFNVFTQFANDETIGNYLKCLKRSLEIYNYLLVANYVSFKVFFIYKDNSFVDSVNHILRSLMNFNLKNLFEFPKIGFILSNLAINLFEKHNNLVFDLDNELICFLFSVLEISIFAPSFKYSSRIKKYEIPRKTSFDTINKFINFCSINKEVEKMDSLLGLLNESFARVFLEMWQNLFCKKHGCEEEKEVIHSMLNFYQGFPSEQREKIILSLPENYREEFDQYLEAMSEDPNELSKIIKSIVKLVKKYFPFQLALIDCFPINWNSTNR